MLLPFRFYKERIRLTDSGTFQPSFGKRDFRSIFGTVLRNSGRWSPYFTGLVLGSWLWKDKELVCFHSQMSREIDIFWFPHCKFLYFIVPHVLVFSYIQCILVVTPRHISRIIYGHRLYTCCPIFSVVIYFPRSLQGSQHSLRTTPKKCAMCSVCV